jgi:hypothetical protein
MERRRPRRTSKAMKTRQKRRLPVVMALALAILHARLHNSSKLVLLLQQLVMLSANLNLLILSQLHLLLPFLLAEVQEEEVISEVDLLLMTWLKWKSHRNCQCLLPVEQHLLDQEQQYRMMKLIVHQEQLLQGMFTMLLMGDVLLVVSNY